MAMQFAKRPWGDVNGEPVWLFDMESGGLRASVSNYGGVIQSLWVTGADGARVDAVLGYDTLEEYRRAEAFLGAMIGPVADRIAGGHCTLDGRTVRLPLNAGPDATHCADRGFHQIVWNWSPMADGLRLFGDLDEASTGFPGTLSVQLRYRLVGQRTLRLEYAARGTRETAVSFTNHTYFTLNGGRGDCLDHELTLFADAYAETERDADPICTGRTLPVDGTPLDFRGGRSIGSAVARTDFGEIARAGGVDHYFPVPGEGLRPQALLRCPERGLALACRSDAPGLLVYTANGLDAERGKGGAVYGPRWGVCLETERFPNAVNLPDRRAQALLRPGETYASATEFEFLCGEDAR